LIIIKKRKDIGKKIPKILRLNEIAVNKEKNNIFLILKLLRVFRKKYKAMVKKERNKISL
jgi:hypothetical protein|tara:strand:+ start:202 stop:381 length:180 start_codon:yes stop_codon:yes gene_type:complete